MNWAELQEGLLIVFGPVWFWFLVVVVVGGLCSLLGVVFMEIAARMTSGR